ncbi:flavin reductase family protein [Komagataeibacter swingsii]|uniref:Flavin reductase n=1 Tax=Komagataeibacter swingsii TaxID=215220 RepID=A0A2V4R7W5_9PROT|nr:flavin reductase family protein [Komagataeibacter swingsii]PYD70908.1 flavin reductase [Komagataeibacter swingsii]GBQ60783.1 flavin reductase domain-containing protein [Komagataeibacter swingsii DSM 16373]
MSTQASVSQHGQGSSERDMFVAAMGHVAAPVAVITTDGPAGRFGITVSSVTSASADPPMMMACINRRSPAFAAIIENGGFVINMLSHGHVGVAENFAGRAGMFPAFDFACAAWKPGQAGGWLLDGALAAFECSLERAVDVGTHGVIIGNVGHTCLQPALTLLHFRRGFHRPEPVLHNS